MKKEQPEPNVGISGKWKYYKDYEYGIAEGEVNLQQEGDELSGRIIFTDSLYDREPYMIQEFLKGRVDGIKIYLDAVEYDFIQVDQEFDYELDNWFGLLLDKNTIKGVSVDKQGTEGLFELTRMD